MWSNRRSADLCPFMNIAVENAVTSSRSLCSAPATRVNRPAPNAAASKQRSCFPCSGRVVSAPPGTSRLLLRVHASPPPSHRVEASDPLRAVCSHQPSSQRDCLRSVSPNAQGFCWPTDRDRDTFPGSADGSRLEGRREPRLGRPGLLLAYYRATTGRLWRACGTMSTSACDPCLRSTSRSASSMSSAGVILTSRTSSGY